MSADDVNPDLDDDADSLRELEEAKHEAIKNCHYRTASRLAQEIKRRARSEHRLNPYVWALHTLTNLASDLLDPEQGREAAIELIAVLESEERARQIQPDLDPGEYEWMVSRVSSCAYDNLGKATGLARGYNSEGLHEAIAEGIQVCRRTGKLECIHCFREYAGEVSLAADDLDMALHHARHGIENSKVNDDFDRRWVGASDETNVLIVAGRIDAAETAARRAWELADTYENRLDACLNTALDLETVGLLKGEPEPLGADERARLSALVEPSAEEFPEFRMRRDLVEALRASLLGEHASAIATLSAWDKRLTDRQCVKSWFEVRLRLIAAHRLAGDGRRAEALARNLEPRAREARDWTTLRRLARLLDPAIPPSPIAPAGPLVTGSTPEPGPVPSAEAPTPDSGPPALDDEAPEPTPLGPAIDALTALLESEQPSGEQDETDGVGKPAPAQVVRETLLAIGPEAATHPADVARMLRLAGFAVEDQEDILRVWRWAEAIANPFPNQAEVLSLLAELGETLRDLWGDDGDPPPIDPERIEALFRQSLDLDPNHLGNFGRAAVHHDRAGRTGEAERCLARVLRLDRGHARAAVWLSRIYRESDRANDALAVLDMALRAGSDSPDVAWQAAILAHNLGRYEAMLTYLDRFEREVPGNPWTNYYRASGLVYLERGAEALEALDEEERRTRPDSLHVLILRGCASGVLGAIDDLRSRIEQVLAHRLADVDDLTHSGMVQLFERLWIAANALADDDPLRPALEQRLLVSGLAPNRMFQGPRHANPEVEGVNVYVCSLFQPLDDRWVDDAGRLAGEDEWTAYRIPWCVVAQEEEEAGRIALEWQARCAPLPASIEQVQLRDEGYTDRPGVLWQGLREGLEPEQDEQPEDEEEPK